MNDRGNTGCTSEENGLYRTNGSWPARSRPGHSLVFLVVTVEHGRVDKTLITTGQAARLLGVSRQHVVDLCDRGALTHIVVGTHRRVPRSEVDRLLGTTLTREQERSRWLHLALFGVLLSDPETALDKARKNIVRWSAGQRPDGMAVRYLEEWARVLDCGLDSVVDVLNSRSDSASELRQNSPFAGLLPNETRVRVLRAFNDHWAREHDGRTIDAVAG